MNRQGGAQCKGAAAHAAETAQRRRRVGPWYVGAMIVLFCVAGSAWWWTQNQGAPLPEVDLRHLDPSIARLIQQGQNEIKTQPHSTAAWGRLGLLLRAYDFPGAARTCFAEAERRDPRDPRWPYFLSLMLKVEAPPHAIAHLRRAVQLCGNDPEMPRLRLATMLAEDGQWEAAEQEVQLLLREHPQYAETWLLVGRLQLLRKDLTNAESSLRRHLELGAESAQGWFQLGLVQLAQQQFSAASDTFRKAAELKPDFGRAFYNRAFALLRNGDLHGPIAPFREAIRLNPERIDSYLLLADIYLQLGNKAEAVKLFRQAEALDANHPGVRQLRQKL